MSQKLVKCKACNNDVSKSAKSCPNCGQKIKKPVYKKWYFWLIIVLVLVVIVFGGNDENKTENDSTKQITSVNSSVVETDVEEIITTSMVVENKTEINDSEEVLGNEFKEAMDKYEEFFDEYVEFMKKYSESNGTDLGLLSDYSEYMTKYAETMKEFSEWEDKDMNKAETAYYIEVQARINKKLLEVAY